MQALGSLPRTAHPDLLVGTSTFDDAGVVRLSGDRALVQTVDFFPPIVDDPRWYGRIAAANALSDVYAMGGRPFSALGIVGWPAELPLDLLAEILAGGQDKLDEAGAMLAGGHSVRDTEVKYGLAVTGLIHPDAIVTNAGAQVGDVLVLTKPIGMGPIATAIKKVRVSQDVAQAAMECMATLNRAGAEAALAVGAHAMTDVTGFGLVGHANEMAEGADLTLELELGALPLFEQALELVRQGTVSGGARRTLSYLGSRLGLTPGIDAHRVTLACDAETSGGLLIAVPEDRADALVAELRGRATPAADVVGRFVARRECTVVLR